MNAAESHGSFLGLPNCDRASADACIVPLPFEGTVSYGHGTAAAPDAVVAASKQVELWDDELDFDLDSLQYHTVAPIVPESSESPGAYLDRVTRACRPYFEGYGLTIGLGGEHSLTPALVSAAVGESDDLSHLTIVQIDAHADLRASYEDRPHSHACAMRRLTDRGASLIAIGVRAMSREEIEYARSDPHIQIYRAQSLETEGRHREFASDERLVLDQLGRLKGDVYLTIDIDGLDSSLCPGTGTPEPGGLSWWQTLRILRRLLLDNRNRRLIGCDLVEAVPQPGTQVNEFTAARLLAKVIAYASA
jgi:agmatinase